MVSPVVAGDCCARTAEHNSASKMAAEKAIDRIESSPRKSNFTALRIFNPPPFRVRDIDPTKAIRRQLLFWPRFQTWRLRSEGRFLGDAIFSPPSSE